ncbi:ADP-ribosylation factor-like protein 4D [Babylonia areolata]|uniref:ADP-ribosylation factor-like protein 4D n=1 Tax=Babylonia areolata TaxID=304850 RepID=UPI003FD22FC0
MGAYVCGASSGLDVAKNTVKILVLGFSGSGKTFVVYSWALGLRNMIETVPTDAAMFNVERIRSPLSGRPLYMWDISGKMIHRRRSYFIGTEGLVYVVDAQKAKVTDVLADLQSLLLDRDLFGVPVLVLVNKVVDGETLSAVELLPRLQKLAPPETKCAMRDVHMHSEQDLSDALLHLDGLVNDRGSVLNNGTAA